MAAVGDVGAAERAGLSVQTHLGLATLRVPGPHAGADLLAALELVCSVPEGMNLGLAVDEVARRAPTPAAMRDQAIPLDLRLGRTIHANAGLFELRAHGAPGDAWARLKPVAVLRDQLRRGRSGEPSATSRGSAPLVGHEDIDRIRLVPVTSQYDPAACDELPRRLADHHRRTRALVLGYDLLLARRGHQTVAHRIRLRDGEELRTHLYDRTSHRLYAAVPEIEDTDLGAAVDHLYRCQDLLGYPAVTVLAPQRPEDGLVTEAQGAGVDVVYLGPDGRFLQASLAGDDLDPADLVPLPLRRQPESARPSGTRSW